MISDTRGLRQAGHGSICGSAASRGKGAPPGVLGLVLTKWRLASTDAGRHEALGFPALSGFVEYLCLATPALLSLGHSGHHGPTCTPQDHGTLRGRATTSLKMELQSVCLFAL